jgi:hypothetical protein
MALYFIKHKENLTFTLLEQPSTLLIRDFEVFMALMIHATVV